jgi:uncharacterized membrane protein
MAMKTSRRIRAVLATAVAALAMTSVATATPAAAARRVKGPEPVNALLQTVNNNQATWVSVWWKTDRTICDAKVRVWGNANVVIGYPSNTATYTSFAHGSTLLRRETDFTSFKVTPHYNRSTWALLAATISYNNCGRHTRTRTKTTGLLLPVSG